MWALLHYQKGGEVMPKLTEKQKRFCEEYLIDLNATQAAIRAGYSSKTASRIAIELLNKSHVSEYLNGLMKHRSQRTEITAERVLQELAAIAFSDRTELAKVSSMGTVEFTPTDSLPDNAKKVIAGIEEGKYGTKITSYDKVKALELLGKHIGIFDGKAYAEAVKEYTGISSQLVAPAFASTIFDIEDHAHTEYVFPGGRGSTKSSFVSLQMIDLLMKHENMHALAMRQVSNTLKDSVFAQILWAITSLGLDGEFDHTRSPLEITRKKTGQKIFFRGADDENKLKSVKAPFGYIGILWFEELDQFRGEEAVRKIEQSVVRGGDIAYIFKSFNPPKSAQNWANRYIEVPNDKRLVTESNYMNVPKKWLGKPFLEQAEHLKATNPAAYENEYMGVANGSGGSVFDNVKLRAITDEELSHFDNIYNGVDWGWYPDLFAFVRVHYDYTRHTLYIWQEFTCNKQSNEKTAKVIKDLGLTENDLITCDSAENKSVGDYRAFGLAARPAEKGPGSREMSYKWLQGLSAIIIDNTRCPVAAKEFIGKEYERDKEGNVISGYPDGDHHTIDAVRYALERVWRRRGQ